MTTILDFTDEQLVGGETVTFVTKMNSYQLKMVNYSQELNAFAVVVEAAVLSTANDAASATASASASATSASASNTSAGQSATSASASNTSAGQSATSAGASNTSAIASAASASESAASAGESATSAGESAASAANALSSENNAAASANYQGSWDNATAYTLSQTVNHGGLFWIANGASTNSEPVTGNAVWSQLLLTVPGYTGKNLLINGDKSINQRNITTTSVVTNTCFIDRCMVQLSGGAAEVIHNDFNTETKSNTVTYYITAGTIFLQQYQEVENFKQLIGKQVTYTAQVKSNIPVVLITDNQISTAHSGNGQWETLSMTLTVTEGIRSLVCAVAANFATAADDYFEIGNEQLELGDTFTGFEIVEPSLQQTRCERYYKKLKFGVSGYQLAGEKFSTTLNFDKMRTSPNITRDTGVVSLGTNQTGDFLVESLTDSTCLLSIIADADGMLSKTDTLKIDAEIY